MFPRMGYRGSKFGTPNLRAEIPRKRPREGYLLWQKL